MREWKECVQQKVGVVWDGQEEKRLCVANWNKYLTDADEMEIGKEHRKCALIVQAVGCNTSIIPIITSMPVFANLITSDTQYLYRNRKFGMLYRLTEDNLITMSIADSCGKWKRYNSSNTTEGDLLTLTEVEEPVPKYYTFKEFVKQWEKRIVQVEYEDRYNEVLLTPNFENDLMGAFYLSSASDGEKDRAVKLAELTTGVLIEMKSDGYVKRVK